MGRYVNAQTSSELLTASESEILRHIALGYSNQEIAYQTSKRKGEFGLRLALTSNG